MDKEKRARFLQQLRLEKNYTQEQLAEILNLNSKSISKYETGVATPDFETYILYSELFKVTLYELSIGERLKENSKLRDYFINRHAIRKLKYKRTLLFAIIAFILAITIYCYTFTIVNYKSIERYEITSKNSNIRINGYYLTNVYYKEIILNGISVNDYTPKLKEKVNYIKYEARYNGRTILSQVVIENKQLLMPLDEAIMKYQPIMYTNSKDVEKMTENDNMTLIIYYGIDVPDKFLEIELGFKKLYSNDKIY